MLVLHPCQQAASHLPCTRPPDRLLPGKPRDSLRGSRRGSHYHATGARHADERLGLWNRHGLKRKSFISGNNEPYHELTKPSGNTFSGKMYCTNYGQIPTLRVYVIARFICIRWPYNCGASGLSLLLISLSLSLSLSLISLSSLSVTLSGPSL